MTPSAESSSRASADVVCDAFRRATGTSPPGLRAEPLAAGHGHENWRVFDDGGGRWLVKIAERRRDPIRMENAVTAQRLAAAAGVRVPEILGFETGAVPLGRPLCVQRWVDGTDAAVVLATMAPEERRTFGSGLGAEVAKLHAVESDWVGEGVLPGLRLEGWRPFVHAQAEKLRALNLVHASLDEATLDAAVGECRRLADEVDSGFRPGLAHRDLWPPNVVVADGGHVAALLDFEHARFTDPAWDLVKLDLLFLRSNADIAASFRGAYAAARGWDDAFDLRIRLCFGLELLRGIPYFAAEFRDAAMAAMLDAELRRWLSVNHSGRERH